ncbi:OmpA family protein [Maridesulfovibrio bastinii]|uniref:OmpA family protein n=1 Tax=Maridesulfovibrio bastinii TaxID=47157 RepID=UPI0004133A7E|nr:OmpA family protein [Maridesulfovibrio bastinii]
MRLKKGITPLFLAALLTVAMVSAAFAESKIVLKPKVDSFALFMDTSPSMSQEYMNTGKSKLVSGLNALKRLNSVIPELGYKSALYTMPEMKTYSPASTYSRGTIARALSAVPTETKFFMSTPIGNSFKDLDAKMSRWPGQLAVIFVSDGLQNTGTNPSKVVRDMVKKYGDRFCLHVISVADTSSGKATLKKLASMTPCGVYVEASDLADRAVLSKYAQDVFYTQEEELIVEIEEEVQEVIPVPVPVEQKIVFRSLNFGFDKYQITDEMVPSLEQAAAILEENKTLDVVVSGHTDSTGPEAYNQGLSERRAASVASWLKKNGINPERITSKGFGELDPKYDNKTREGRKLNRRVEIDVK